MGAPQPILHHYWPSPYSEKVRVMFGLKQIEWGSVVIPSVMPKPEYTPLTGGYRRTPSLQVGADVYCDTRLIADYLERRYPSPSLYGDASAGLCEAITTWAEDRLFWPIARYVIGINAEEVGPALHADRAAMRGRPPIPADKVKAAAPGNLPDIHLQLSWIEDMLARSDGYILGAQPSLADMSVYHCVWFLGALPVSAASLLAGYPNTSLWVERMKSLGHGSRQKMKGPEALEVAASST
ncbi:MAG: glutathione S-transferase family protein, partial [Myxococcota bacterium]